MVIGVAASVFRRKRAVTSKFVRARVEHRGSRIGIVRVSIHKSAAWVYFTAHHVIECGKRSVSAHSRPQNRVYFKRVDVFHRQSRAAVNNEYNLFERSALFKRNKRVDCVFFVLRKVKIVVVYMLVRGVFARIKPGIAVFRAGTRNEVNRCVAV